MAVPFWAGRYIGLPFKLHGRDRSGLDCWGLVRLVMAEQFGKALPSYSSKYERETQEVVLGDLITQEAELFWQPVPSGQEAVGDVIVLRMRGRPMHVGIVIGDRHMLHIERGIDSCIEKYNGIRWMHRIFGFYRHVHTIPCAEE